MPDITCPLPETLDYAKAKTTYSQVRKDTNYKLSPDANAREAARRLNVDVETFVQVLKTKKPYIPSPVTVPVTTPSVEVAVDEVIDYKKAKATYAQVRKDTKYKLTPHQNRVEAARRLNISVEDFARVMDERVSFTRSAVPALPKVPEPLALTRWSRKTKELTGAEDAMATNPGWELRRPPATKVDDVQPIIDSMGLGEQTMVSASGDGTVFIVSLGPEPWADIARVTKKLRADGWTVQKGFSSSNAVYVRKPSGIIKGTRSNCPSCTTTWELRRRGYDVVARRMDDGETIREIYSSWNAFKTQLVSPEDKALRARYPDFGWGKEMVSFISEAQFRDEVMMMDVGARGFIANQWKAKGAHIWNWEVRMTNGRKQIWFIDGQSGEEWPVGSRDKYLSRSKENMFNVIRTDQLPDPGGSVEHLTSDVIHGQTQYTGRP